MVHSSPRSIRNTAERQLRRPVGAGVKGLVVRKQTRTTCRAVKKKHVRTRPEQRKADQL